MNDNTANISVFTRMRPRTGVAVSALAVMIAFLAGGFVGWVYETFLCATLNGEDIDLSHGGLGIPFLQIYAIGAAVIEIAFGLGRERELSWWLQFVLCGVLCTALEYAAGLSMLYGVGVQTWDYRIPGWDFMCTEDGLICLRASLTFAAFGLVLLRVIDPIFWRLWGRPEAEESDSDEAKTTDDRIIARRIIAVITVICVIGVIFAMLNSYVLGWIDVGGTWH